MTPISADHRDIELPGLHGVVLVNGQRDFKAQQAQRDGSTVWLAGGWVDPIAADQVTATQAASLFGAFVLLRHDPAARTLTLMTDRFGHFPCYVAHGTGSDSGRLVIGTDFALVAARCGASLQLDSGAMADILAFNVPFGERTPSARVTCLGGSLELVIDLETGAQQRRRLWDPAGLLACADLSFNDTKDRLVDLFLEGVSLASAQCGTVAVTLSGGADSRCLLAASLHAGRNTAVYSTGVPGSRALAYAHGMALQCGVAENSHPLDESFLARFPALMQESNRLMQGMSFSSELEAMWLRQHVAPEGALLHGAFAELFKIGKMHNYHYDSAIAGLSGDAVTNQLWQRFASRNALRRQGFREEYTAALGEQAREHLAQKVARYQSTLDTAGVLQMIYIDEFLGKVAKSSWHMWRQRIPTVFPFAYPPLVDLILRVRTVDKVDNRFVVHLLRRTNKILAKYPDSNTGVRIGASRLHRELVHVIDYATNRLFRRNARSDHQDFAGWLRRMQPGLEAVFDRLQQATGAYNMDHVRSLIASCRSGDDLAARTLQFLWAWGLWRTDGPMQVLQPAKT
ncbi:MAG: hypothetical protein HY021_03760 [Burkholderiales bacterium]|nr:hypothetical protein [Burkholderiales bacterium]